MPTYNDYGIVLSRYNLGESDKILNIYTKEHGLVKAVCKGARKIRSKFGPRVDQLSSCYFQFARGRNLDIVSECEQVNSFSKLKSDLTRLSYAVLFIEIVNSFAHELEAESSHIYSLLYSGLETLQKASSPELEALNFILEFLSVHGYKPQLETCVSCSKEVMKSGSLEIGKNYPYSDALGGLLCNQCSKIVDYKPVSTEVLRILKHQSLAEKSSYSQSDLRSALGLLQDHIDIRAKNKIKSFDLVFSL